VAGAVLHRAAERVLAVAVERRGVVAAVDRLRVAVAAVGCRRAAAAGIFRWALHLVAACAHESAR